MIFSRFNGTVTRTGNRVVEAEIGIELMWDPDHDPFAVVMVCSAPGADDITWKFSRALMADGYNCRHMVGDGDIRFIRLMDGFGVCLRTEDGHADMILPLRDVEAFIGKTMEHTPLGEEKVDDMIDAFVKEVLEG